MDKEKYIVDFTNVKYYLEMHEVIKKSLDFPDYYGRNWSAFWDCLSDMRGDTIHIEIIGIEVIERKFENAAEKMVEILTEYVEIFLTFYTKRTKTTAKNYICGGFI